MDVYILSSCRITNDRLIADGKEVLTRNCEKGPAWLNTIYRALGIQYPKFFKMDNLAKVGFLAAEVVMHDTEIARDRENYAVVCLNSASSIDDDRAYQQTIASKELFFPSPAVFVYTLANIVTGEIAIRHNIFGESSFYVYENFSALRLYDSIKDVFNNPDMSAVIGGWVNYDEDCDVLMLRACRLSDPEKMLLSENNINNLYK
ncbi:MAG: hypothetical protein PHR20_06645 [Bacteroidales bacterium]|nr:hypothetical protein [Bacteroidales bacterium]